jgi:hypothetical protein
MAPTYHLDLGTEQVFSFFDEVGYLARRGVLPLERVWSHYGGITMAWVLWEPAVKKMREERKDPSIYEDMEYLYHQMVNLARQRGVGSEHPTKEELRRFVEDNLGFAEARKEPAAGGEDPRKG